jgi:hypothetical protein
MGKRKELLHFAKQEKKKREGWEENLLFISASGSGEKVLHFAILQYFFMNLAQGRKKAFFSHKKILTKFSLEVYW